MGRGTEQEGGREVDQEAAKTLQQKKRKHANQGRGKDTKVDIVTTIPARSPPLVQTW